MKKLNIRETMGLEAIQGATFISLTMQTPVKLLGGKKNPQQGRVEKLTTTQGMIFTNKNKNAYEAMVNRRLEKEGKPAVFTVGEPTWASERVIPGVVSYQPKGGDLTYYLEFIKTGKQTSQYLLDGKPVDKSMIEGLSSPTGGKQGGLDDKVQFRKVKIDNLRQLSANGLKVEGRFYFE